MFRGPHCQLCSCLFCVFFVVVWLFFGLVCFPGGHPNLDMLDCVLVMLSFDSPMREHTGHCTIRSMAQTLCYDLARAKKAKDGKKKRPSLPTRCWNSTELNLLRVYFWTLVQRNVFQKGSESRPAKIKSGPSGRSSFGPFLALGDYGN